MFVANRYDASETRLVDCVPLSHKTEDNLSKDQAKFTVIKKGPLHGTNLQLALRSLPSQTHIPSLRKKHERLGRKLRHRLIRLLIGVENIGGSFPVALRLFLPYNYVLSWGCGCLALCIIGSQFERPDLVGQIPAICNFYLTWREVQ